VVKISLPQSLPWLMPVRLGTHQFYIGVVEHIVRNFVSQKKDNYENSIMDSSSFGSSYCTLPDNWSFHKERL
jgi:hypothetical protein